MDTARPAPDGKYLEPRARLSSSNAPSNSPPRAHSHKRRTVALLLDYLGCSSGAYHGEVRDAFDRACVRRGYNLMVLAGRALEDPGPGPAAYNFVYDLVTPDAADAIVLLAGGLAACSGLAGLQRLCARYGSVPRCSFGVRLPGVSSVTFDDDAGMDELMDHLLVHHGCRNLAFIAGPEHNPDAASRLRGYERGLERHRSSVAASLIERGNFTVNSGASAMKQLLGRGLPIDAVVAANDGMALGALSVLKERGLRVPQDILVTGFDDAERGRFADPPLTTLRQPLEAMAEQALVLLDGQLLGQSVPDEARFGVTFVPRHSCGCGVGGAAARPPEKRERMLSAVPTLLERVDLFPRALARLGAADDRAFERMRGGPAVIESELLSTLEECTQRAPLGREVEFVDALTDDLHELEAHWSTRSASPQSAKMRALFGSARELLLAAQLRFRVQRARETEEHYHAAAHVAEMVSSALDRDTLRDVLTAEIGGLGLRRVLVLLYPEQGPLELRPFLSWPEPVPSEPCAFEPRKLMPASQGARCHWILLPLVSEEKRWGVILLEPGPKPVDHERLPELLSSPLNHIALHREIVEKTALHARSVQERQATTERLQALGVLAAGVAHDLNNSLGPLLALPDVMTKQLDGMTLDSECAGELRRDLAAIRAATVRASRTIKDLVTLGRQRRLPRAPLDLNRVASACLLGPDSPYERSGSSPRVLLHPEPLPISASESHLARALLNLVQNAVEACGTARGVTVSTQSLSLSAPRAGYETIEPGSYAVLRVSDCGPGVSSEILGRIFEPFFSHKPPSETSGSGLGLALVHGIVKEHGGFVDVERTPGQGATFALYFPQTSAPLRESTRPRAAKRGDAKVLVIDDDPLQLRTARRVLESLGYQAATLASGRAACRLFDEASQRGDPSPYGLVIADMALGEDRDGLEVCQHIRGIYPAQKVLIVSGHATLGRIEASPTSVAWLSKPYAANELGCLVSDVLEAAVPA